MPYLCILYMENQLKYDLRVLTEHLYCILDIDGSYFHRPSLFSQLEIDRVDRVKALVDCLVPLPEKPVVDTLASNMPVNMDCIV